MRVYQKSAEDVRRGRGLIGNLLNKAVDILPIELHVPGYQYCGPVSYTHLDVYKRQVRTKRLSNGTHSILLKRKYYVNEILLLHEKHV